MSKQKKATDFDLYLKEKLSDKKVKKYFDEYGNQLELAYQILKLRKSRKLSQLDLAKKLGTSQSNIARIEGGRENFTVASLGKIAKALDVHLEIVLK